MTRIFHRFFMWKMDPISDFDIRLVFTLPPRDITMQYKRCVHFWNNFPCLTILARSEIAIKCVLDCDYVSVSAFEWVWLCECVCVWVSECVCVKESVGCGLNSIVYSVECTGVNQLYIYNQREQYYLFTKWMNGWI